MNPYIAKPVEESSLTSGYLNLLSFGVYYLSGSDIFAENTGIVRSVMFSAFQMFWKTI